MNTGPIQHSHAEDLSAMIVGSILVGFGIATLHAAGLVTGGMAGLALLVGHFAPIQPGLLFALLNGPFLFLAFRAMGLLFTVRTVTVSSGIALSSVISEKAFTLIPHNPVIPAIWAGTMLGMGTLAAVRHGAGVGGVGILTFWLHHTRGWNIGRIQLVIDGLILTASALFLPMDKLACSAAAAATMGLITGMWIRPGRYAGFSPLRKSVAE